MPMSRPFSRGRSAAILSSPWAVSGDGESGGESASSKSETRSVEKCSGRWW